MLVSPASLVFAIYAEIVAAVPGARRSIEVQGHRGAIGLAVENTAYGFAYAIEAGVEVLELDILFTKDGVPVVWHDPRISKEKCKDTGDGTYVGELVYDLTLAQLKTLDCGSQQASGYRQQKLHPGATIQTFDEIIDLVDCYGNKDVRLNVELKVDPMAEKETAPVEKYINDIVPILQKRGYAKRSTIQSFDWRTIIGIKKKWPEITTAALIHDISLMGSSKPGGGKNYIWMGGIDLDEHDGDWVKAAAMTDASIIAVAHGTTLSSGASTNSPNYKPFLTKDVVKRAHRLGLKVNAWTVDDEVTMQKLIEDGVDGLISNYPERAFYIARKNGYSTGISTTKPKPECLKHAGSL